MSQTTRSKSEFLGLHDPFAVTPSGLPSIARPAPKKLDADQKSELWRAAVSLTVLFGLIAIVIKAIF